MNTPAVIVTTPEQLRAIVSAEVSSAIAQMEVKRTSKALSCLMLTANQMGAAHNISGQGWLERVKKGTAPAPDQYQGRSPRWSVHHILGQQNG